ncbi:hypothetical protein [Chondromyces apiculatus]|uniref:Uncharacterized protein n=1 Tax=Chondromyces apiculatus DSM 436 TaxID=1192034 RepID=A0A017SZ47_9BACT|nr:hypothetical protein [Chondromyces apiculatus]EYF01890.1 Hypothetical protein CAP_7658 [Chondromyces apiculatus DSM 436]
MNRELLVGVSSVAALAAAALAWWFGGRRAVAPAVARKWSSFSGSRPEAEGWPKGSILAVPGLERLTAAGRRELLAVARELGVPVDSLATVIAHESGGKTTALNSLPAAGLIQITTGAELPGFETPEKIRAVATWDDVRQIREVVRPFYARLLARYPHLRSATPGELLVANFLPSDSSKPLDHRLADEASESERRRNIYAANRGLDRAGKGYVTVADLHEVAAEVTGKAAGKRLTPRGTVAAPAQPPGAPPARSATGTGVGSRGATPADRVPAAGLLRAAVEAGLDEAVDWVEVPWEGHTVRVGAHALRAPYEGKLVRLPVSSADAFAICRAKGWVLPTASLSDAIWRAATVRLVPKPLPPDDRMSRMGHVLVSDAEIERQIAGRPGLAADEGKDLILAAGNALRPGTARDYGWRDAAGNPLQPLGPSSRPPQHDAGWIDYSRKFRPIQRFTREGRDLLDLFVAQGMPEAVVAPLR